MLGDPFSRLPPVLCCIGSCSNFPDHRNRHVLGHPIVVSNYGDDVIDFGQVIIFPQGLGGIKTYLNANPSTTGNILAVDIGFNTVIYTLYSCAQGEILTGKTFYKKGIHDMAVNTLFPEIQRHIQGKTLTPLEIDYVMQTGALQVGFDSIDIKPEIDEAARSYVNDLLALVTGDLKAYGGVAAFDTVLFSAEARGALKGK